MQISSILSCNSLLIIELTFYYILIYQDIILRFKRIIPKILELDTGPVNSIYMFKLHYRLYIEHVNKDQTRPAQFLLYLGWVTRGPAGIGRHLSSSLSLQSYRRGHGSAWWHEAPWPHFSGWHSAVPCDCLPPSSPLLHSCLNK